jgi:hypothetical protein
MIFLRGAIISFKVIFSLSWIIFSILLTIVLSMLTKDHMKSTKKKIFPDEH